MPDSDLTFQKEARKALTNFYNLAYLCICPLAETLLPTKERGQALQQLLREAIEHLKPAGSPSEGASEWRPYLILYSKYIERQDRQQVLDKLAISDATFVREQRQAIAAVCDILKAWQKELCPPSVSPQPIPTIETFVGREAELAAYQRQLVEDHWALIAGPPGAGKTTLGAELAASWQTKGHPVLWITARNGQNTTLEALLEEIALALAARGQVAFWRFLQAERHKEHPLSLGSKAHYLLTNLEEGKETGSYLLCLDDFHLMNDNPAIHSLCADLLCGAEQGKLRLLVISRVTPHFVRDRPVKPLGGLCQKDARRLLEESGLPKLPEDIFVDLYTRTSGLPVFFKLFAAWAHNQKLADIEEELLQEKLATFARNLVKENDVRRYLLHQVYETLNPQERRFLLCVAAFRLPIKTEDAPIIDLLRAEGVQDIEDTWMALAERHIFTRLEKDAITLHPLVRDYFRHRLRLSPDDQTRIHQRVGKYYERSEQSEQCVGDVLEAGYHYFEAGHYEQAAQLLCQNVPRLINTGQAELALEQLEQLTPHLARTTGVERRFEAALAREVLCHLLGQREKQAAILDTLQSLAKGLGDTRRSAIVYNRRARLCQVMGKLEAAIAAAEAGQAAARQAGDKVVEAESLHHWGTALWLQSDYAAARQRHEQALALAQEVGDRRGEADNLNRLGNICYCLEDYAAAQDFYEQALNIWQAMADRQGIAHTLDNLGSVYYSLGDYVAARDSHKRALALAQEVGNRRGEAASMTNLGVVYSAVGDQPAAQACWEQALAVARAIGAQRSEAANLHNLGDIYCEEGDYTTAQAYQEQSLAICRAIGNRRGVSQALTGLGKVMEGIKDLDRAEAAYREALAIRREIGEMSLSIEDVAGLGRVALGQVESGGQKAKDKRQDAKQYAEEYLAHIAAHGAAGIEYVIESYLDCIHILEACGEHEQAIGALEKAHALLMQRADKISDEAMRRSYLENVPANRELVRRWTQERARSKQRKAYGEGNCAG